MAKKLFDKEKHNIFRWEEIKTFLIQSQYNELLESVTKKYKEQFQTKTPLPNFLNNKYCLTLLTAPEHRPQVSAHLATSFGLKDNQVKLTGCLVDFANWCQMPQFKYIRQLSLSPTDENQPNIVKDLDFGFDTESLTVGAVIWLYFYERMGIFKILGALLDDYNYRGKFTISGRRQSANSDPISYSTLMDMICTLHRVGISSNLRDRICLYQRVLGVSIENNLNIESERNTGFMQTFNKLIDYMVEYYRSKQLAQAINPLPGGIRSSVATQTSIRDTINVLKQHFEPLQYGRNLINTFLGIATVHATICLVNELKAEIGIPTQYERPEEFIPAAYDILVAKRSHTLNQSNRFIIYDNCASYGYRLLTDIEIIDLEIVTTAATQSKMDTWLDDVEGLVEGYRNAYGAVSEKVAAIV
jgi:hypothetical protein